MARGGNNGNLTSAHQRAAAIMPRGPRGMPASMKPSSGETLESAMLRYQQAKADTETLDAEKRALDVARMRGDLIAADDARDEIEATHLRWVAELEQLPHLVASALPPEVGQAMRELVRAQIEASAIAIRHRIGGDQ